jgi:hypothetical protein
MTKFEIVELLLGRYFNFLSVQKDRCRSFELTVGGQERFSQPPFKPVTCQVSLNIMGKSHQKSTLKTPPGKGPKTRTSPRIVKANERERGSGPVGRGGKMALAKNKMSSKGRQSMKTSLSSSLSSSPPSSSSSLSLSSAESDKDDVFDEGDRDEKRNNVDYGKKTSNNFTREELLNMLREKERIIKKLQAEMEYMKNRSKPSKKTIREMMMWSGEEINFSESVNTFVREFLFPRYKFLKDGWQRYEPNMKNSLSSMCLRRLSLPEASDREDIWIRVIVPSIQMKYINIKGNMNNDLKNIYMSVYCVMYVPNCDLMN